MGFLVDRRAPVLFAAALCIALGLAAPWPDAAALARDVAGAGAAAMRPAPFMSPQRYQFDLELNNISGFVDDSSLVRRREDSIAGSALHFGPDLGVSTIQLPEVNATFWFDSLNAVQFQWRSLLLYGSEFLSSPVTFNGDVIAPGQNISTDGTEWFTAGIFYERRISPWLSRYQEPWPWWLKDWELRPRIGLEFTFLDFRINDGHPRLISGKLEARGRFRNQELPVPTLSIDARRSLTENLIFQMSAQGEWINKWNSFRNQKGTIYLSQSEFETHWRLIYLNPELRGFQPFGGIAYYYYKQAETSAEIGNLVRLQTFGPEVGVAYSF